MEMGEEKEGKERVRGGKGKDVSRKDWRRKRRKKRKNEWKVGDKRGEGLIRYREVNEMGGKRVTVWVSRVSNEVIHTDFRGGFGQ